MDVFSEDKLNKIFKCYEGQDSNKIISRESTTLEFKASFSTSAIPIYAKTMAAFANRDGGYIIFGVKNNPRMVIGLKDNTFDEYDDEKFVKNLNEYFSPEIKYDRIQINYKDLNVGILYVFPSEAKPVVCTKNYNSGDKQLLREGAIYYRYRSASSEIKYSDLRVLLDKQKEDERKLWLQTFAKIAKIGVNYLSLIDLKDGLISVLLEFYLLILKNLKLQMKMQYFLHPIQKWLVGVQKKLNYTRNKGLDFVARFNNKYIIGEAKFLTDFGGHQNAQFEDAISTIETPDVKAIKIAILDGVLYINGTNKMHSTLIEKSKTHDIMSALILRDYLYSI